MALPATGYTATFSGTIEDPGGVTVIEETPFECPVRKTTSGVAADYCGFTIEVFEDTFSFDVDPYLSFSWYFGWTLIEITGEGDETGGVIHVEGEPVVPADYWWRMDYTVTHTGSIDLEKKEVEDGE